MQSSRSRSLVAVVALLISTAASAGCSSTTESVSSTGTSPTTVPGSTGPVGTVQGSPETTYPDSDVPAVTDPTESPTIPASGDDPELLDCGTIYRASGWPTTFLPSRDAFTCLGDAFVAGTPARLVDREQTDGEGGAILVTTYDVLGPGQVRVTVDASEAADRPQGVTVSECTALTTEFVTVITSGCTVVSS